MGRSPGREGEQLDARQPGPANVAIARKQFERFKRFLRDQPARYERIVELRLKGHDCVEIGRILDLSERTVRRFLDRLYAAIDV